ncbi:50S ribosomal protein L13 [Candidatus Roizmanbacteria bacterium]|jgi:large subunit ribosomal protein L13|nr:50S ribosomal protein L13 [Candidatus Roizmanbacteria bacterium]
MVNLTKITKPVKISEIVREWHVIDANGKVLGRLSSAIVKILQGKHKSNYCSYLDMGDNVVVINARKVIVTGKKADTKEYTSYSGYPSGQKTVAYKRLMADNPAEIIKRAVSGMLPKNKLRDRRLTRLFIFVDDNHPYKEKLKVK